MYTPLPIERSGPQPRNALACDERSHGWASREGRARSLVKGRLHQILVSRPTPSLISLFSQGINKTSEELARAPSPTLTQLVDFNRKNRCCTSSGPRPPAVQPRRLLHLGSAAARSKGVPSCPVQFSG